MYPELEKRDNDVKIFKIRKPNVKERVGNFSKSTYTAVKIDQ